jgi:hypothetical protein
VERAEVDIWPPLQQRSLFRESIECIELISISCKTFLALKLQPHVPKPVHPHPEVKTDLLVRNSSIDTHSQNIWLVKGEMHNAIVDKQHPCPRSSLRSAPGDLGVHIYRIHRNHG